MKDNTQKKSRSDQSEIESEENENTNDLAKKETKGHLKRDGKTQPKSPSKGKGKTPGDSKPPPAPEPTGKLSDATAPLKGSTGSAKRKKGASKTHKKKGSANDVPPSSIGMTQVAFAALLAIEAANPEMTRKQIFENALTLLAGHVAHVPPIYLARLDSDALIIMAGAAAKWEKSCKKIMREIILAELDDDAKAELVGQLEMEIQKAREERLIRCRMAGIPISHDLITDVSLSIGALQEKIQETHHKSFQNSFDNAIKVLTAYMPYDSGETKNLCIVSKSQGETQVPDNEEDPEAQTL